MSGNRRRSRSGAEIERHETFYCIYGKHYVIPLKFENSRDNKGICMGCALEVYDVLRAAVYIPEMTPRARMNAWKEFHRERSVRETKEQFKRGSDDPGWVYYIAQGDLIKIGYAKDVTQRMKAYGPTAELLAVHPGTLALEKQMHTKFKGALERGREWFRPEDDLTAHIESIRERFGDPSAFAYEFTKPKTEEEIVRAMFATRPFPSLANGAHSSY